MNSEELNRAIEFLIQHEARMDAQQQEDKRLMQELVVNHKRMSDLIVIESGRLDRADQRLDRAEREDRAAQKRHVELMREMRDGIERILKKLDERPQ
jgi:hypothetical protein